ncbi:hypothetical protein M422DRAFT_778458, partial [Sphaerobolus stellatus SS14]
MQLLPTVQDCWEPRIWAHEDIGLSHLRGFTIDPAQDVIILVEQIHSWPTHAEMEIHVRSINTGRPHPEAQQPIICCEAGYAGWDAFGVVVRSLGEIVGILFQGLSNGPGDQLYIWNWKSGILVSFLAAER